MTPPVWNRGSMGTSGGGGSVNSVVRSSIDRGTIDTFDRLRDVEETVMKSDNEKIFNVLKFRYVMMASAVRFMDRLGS